MQNLLIYGGTFDPPHLGHINTLNAIQKKLKFSKVFILPCKKPVLKNANIASAEQRLAMLKLIFPSQSIYKIDTREIDRATPSYLVDTLLSYRKEYLKGTSINVLLGADSFCTLTQWYQWQKIPQLCNLVVMRRSDIKGDNNTVAIKHFKLQSNAAALKSVPSGAVAFIDAGNYPISSTKIRQKLKNNEVCHHLLNDKVIDYIQQHKIYSE